MRNFLFGSLFGMALSVAYVWYGVSLPKWLELPGAFQRSVKAAAVDETLYDLKAPADMRLRALEVFFENQAKRAAKLDAKLGHPILGQLETQRVRRKARMLRGLWSAYDVALDKPHLREALVRQHGDVSNELLKRRMLLKAVQKEEYLMGWLRRERKIPNEANVREVLAEVSRVR